MRFALWISLAIAVLAVLFALQNATPVLVRIGPAEFQGSLALVLLVTLVIGVLIGYLATLGRRMKAGWQIFRLRRDLNTERGETNVPMTPPPGPVPGAMPPKSAPASTRKPATDGAEPPLHDESR